MRPAFAALLFALVGCDVSPLDGVVPDQTIVEDARIVRARVEIPTLQAELARYRAVRGSWPEEWSALRRAGWDPWGHAYAYEIERGVPVVFSAGPDGEFDTEDDIYVAR